MTKKVKIIFLLPSLVAGGAERVISFVSQNIDQNLFDSMLVIAGHEKDCVYDVSKVKVKYLNKKRVLTALPSILKIFINSKPDIVVSSIAHVNKAMSIVAPFFESTKFIGRESTVLSERRSEPKKNKFSLIQYLPIGFNNLDMLICQSKDMAEDIFLNYNLPRYKIRVINNPISNFTVTKSQDEQSNSVKRFITVGRLTEVKGYTRILNILSRLKIPFTYTIIGDGPLRNMIMEKIKLLGLNEQINYIPYTNEINEQMIKNDIFIQGSFVEGFPNALLESCAVGTPAIAFNVPGGTKEIIENGVNGYLVDTEDEFLEKLEMEQTWDPGVVRNSVYRKFNKEKIIKEYENLFLEVLNQ